VWREAREGTQEPRPRRLPGRGIRPRLDNLLSGPDGDNHGTRFGFLTNSTTVDIYHADLTPTTPWSYEFRYGVLA
jgi:hypothetical protein